MARWNELPLLVCPFCHRRRRVGGFAIDEVNGTLYHTLPYCVEFDSLDPLEFTRAVARALEKH